VSSVRTTAFAMNQAMKIIFALALVASSAESKSCRGQERFNTMMCESHMCTDCQLAYCMEECQKIQLEFPTCRCEQWPEERTSFSGGEFAGKGKFGDAGDYSK